LEDFIVDSGANYLVKDIPADQLVNRIFVESFIKRGEWKYRAINALNTPKALAPKSDFLLQRLREERVW
jgi:hypothetical protein